MRPGLLVLAAALIATGCSEPVVPRTPSAIPDAVVFYESEPGITVADILGGVVLSSDATVAGPNWTRLFAVRGDELVTFEPISNTVLGRAAVPGRFTARVASATGGLVALTEGRPGGRDKTAILVADPSGQRPAVELRLSGSFEPEAFSADGAFLYVLEYLPANAPDRYRVRRVELATGAVQPLLLRDKSAVPPSAEEEMRGEGRQAVLSPDHSRLYTLYLHRGDHQHTRDLLPGRRAADGRAVHAFVHVLSLTEGWAYCLDLPDPFGTHPAGTHALTIAPDGRTLYVAEMASKRVAVADIESLAITRVATLRDDQAGGDGTAMAASPDGAALYLGSSNLLRRLDTRTLRVDRTWAQPTDVRGLAVSDDGRQVFLGQAGTIARLDAETGQLLGSFAADGLKLLRGNVIR